MNVLISTDKKSFDGAKILVYSLMKYHKNVHWHVLSASISIESLAEKTVYRFRGIDDDDFIQLKKIVKYFDSDSTIELTDVTGLYGDYLAGSPNDLAGFTPYATFRLLADIVIPKSEHDLLYLDVDTMVCQNIDTEYHKYTTIDSPYAAHVVREACDYKGEMISGIMFFNMDICRRTKFFDTARRNYMKYDYQYPDQMAIRDTADPVNIEKSLNYMWDLVEATEPFKIIHFTNELEKVYAIGWHKFFLKYPQYNEIKEGIELLDELKFNTND